MLCLVGYLGWGMCPVEVVREWLGFWDRSLVTILDGLWPFVSLGSDQTLPGDGRFFQCCGILLQFLQNWSCDRCLALGRDGVHPLPPPCSWCVLSVFFFLCLEVYVVSGCVMCG